MAPYLPMSYIYERSNRFWHFLIRSDPVHMVWRSMVELTRPRHLRFPDGLDMIPASTGAAGCVMPAGV